MSFIAGRYNATYGTGNPSIGQVKDGFTIEMVARKQVIRGDNYLGAQDAIYQGMEVFIEFVLMEYTEATTKTLIWPYNATFGDGSGVGELESTQWGGTNAATTLVLQDITGLPSADTPNSLTAARAILAEDYPIEFLLAPALREIPVRMRLYPTGTGPSTDDTAFFVVD